MRKSLLAVVCAVMFGACAWGESSGPNEPGPTPDSGTQQNVCGDGTCAPSEVGQCTSDCGSSTGPMCGNGSCETGENSTNCVSDCPPSGPVCGDTICDMAGGENSTNCPGDCGGGGGGDLDCNDQNTLLACFACIATGACLPPATEEACLTCIGGGGGFSFCDGMAPDGVCSATEDETICPEDCP